MKPKLKNVVLYYDPHLLRGGENEPEETVSSLKEKADRVRSFGGESGASVLIRDAGIFSELESRVLGVVLVGDSDSDSLLKVREAYEKVQIPVASFDKFASKESEGAFDVNDGSINDLPSLRARATDLGVDFSKSDGPEKLQEAIEQKLRSGDTEDNTEGDGQDVPDDGTIPAGEPVEFDPKTADMESLKKYADDHSISYSPSIGEDTLRERIIDNFKSSS